MLYYKKSVLFLDIIITFIFNDEIIETTMDDIEAYKVQKLYDSNKQYLEAAL